MSKRYQGGILGVGFNPLQAPNAPTNVTATGGDASASVSFTAPTNVGGSAITGYTVQSNPGNFVGSGASSPITVSGLSNGTSYTFNVWALNTYGPSPAGGPSGSVTPTAIRGLFAGGYGVSAIQYVSIASTGNAISFGNLTRTGNWMASCSSSTRGIWAGGGDNDRSNIIDYVTIATTGNATDFGDLTQPVGSTANLGMAGASNSTRGIFAGGSPSSGETSSIQYITMATTGNATSFGQLTSARTFLSSCASPTRSVFAGGNLSFASSPQTTIDYITTATTGNATSFGSLSANSASMAVGVCSSSTRGLFAAVGATYGSGASNIIEYITIATTGNSTDFGDLIVANAGFRNASTSSPTRGLVAGGGDSVNTTNVIQYVTISTTGNATDFGDLTAAQAGQAGCSNGHGGL